MQLITNFHSRQKARTQSVVAVSPDKLVIDIEMNIATKAC